MKAGPLQFILFLLLCVTSMSHAQTEFAVSAEEQKGTDGQTIQVSLAIPEHHYVYASSYRVEGMKGTALDPVTVPVAKSKKDPFSGELTEVYDHSFDAVYRVAESSSGHVVFKVNYQGCNEDTCFLPQTERFDFAIAGEGDVSVDAAGPVLQEVASWKQIADSFEIVAVETGYMSVERMLEFLSLAQEGKVRKSVFALEQHSFWVAIGLILLGGLALNLTPCVLPMLPINLAIIGAGTQAGSRGRGFVLGGVYGAGIALTYGVLGLVVVLTGSTFGSLNASPWFNVAIAVVFVILGRRIPNRRTLSS